MNRGDAMKRITILFVLVFISICSSAFAGFNVCGDKDLSMKGSSPIDGCIYYSDKDMVEYTRVKSLFLFHRSDFLKLDNGKVIEKTTVEKDAILSVEAQAVEDNLIARIESGSITILELLKALEAKSIITMKEITDEVKKDNNLSISA